MSNYVISEYSKRKAKQYGVTIKSSSNKKKKIDVFKNDTKIATIGDVAYLDYSSYLKTKGKIVADEKKRLYKIRHKKDLESKNGKWAHKLLW